MDVYSGVVVAVMDDATTGANPTPIRQFQLLDMPAIGTGLRRRIEAVNQMNNFAFGGCNILQDAHKLGARQVIHFAPPHGLHPLHSKVFKEQIVVPVRQLMCQLEEPIAATVDHALIDTCDSPPRLVPVARTFALARHTALRLAQFIKRLVIVQRGLNLLPVRCGEESLQTKIKTCAVTCHGLIALVDFFLHHKVEVEIAQRVALDCDRLDARGNVTTLAVLIDLALNVDAVAFKQFPTSLLKREGSVLLDLLERGWRGLDLALKIAKEQLVSAVNALCNVLNRLRTNQLPMSIAGQLLELGQMLHQCVSMQVLAGQPVIAPMKRDAVVVNQARNVNLLMQMLILFCAVQLELVGLGQNHWFFWSSM